MSPLPVGVCMGGGALWEVSKGGSASLNDITTIVMQFLATCVGALCFSRGVLVVLPFYVYNRETSVC